MENVGEEVLVLFDIDGTLIYSGGAGVRALNLALRDLTGIPEGFAAVDCAGKTDPQIIREGFRHWRLSLDDGMMGRFIDRYLHHLSREVRRGLGHVKPGVWSLLRSLKAMEGVHLGLLTGNLEPGARIKLEPFGLNPFFPFGAFGSDHEDRNRLLPVAVERLKERQGRTVAFPACVVIGDTPRDILCARVHGARSLAVATGPYSVEELEESGADLVVPDFRESEKILRWIHGIRSGEGTWGLLK
jgi:phosphoglycolate phosphatase-like HAD superfamily hydrolase